MDICDYFVGLFVGLAVVVALTLAVGDIAEHNARHAGLIDRAEFEGTRAIQQRVDTLAYIASLQGGK